MADSRFFSRCGPFSIAELATLSDAVLSQGSNPDKLIRDVAPLDQAEYEDLSFVDNPKYIDEFASSRAGACIVHPMHEDRAPPGMALLLSEKPYRSYALAARAFYPEATAPLGIASSAHVDATAQIGENCAIASGAVIHANVRIGDRCTIGANTVIGNAVYIGDDVWIGPLATLGYCVIGSRVRIYTGVRIGQDGFGFAPDPAGYQKVPQLGRVIIGHDVEIGANSTIDRGSGRDTIVGDGCWIDNLVQIAHNVELGRGCILAAQSGVSGSTKLGNYVVMGGQVGVAGHLLVGDGARLAAKSGIAKDVPAGAVVGGTPAVPIRAWHRQTHILAELVRHKGKTDE